MAIVHDDTPNHQSSLGRAYVYDYKTSVYDKRLNATHARLPSNRIMSAKVCVSYVMYIHTSTHKALYWTQRSTEDGFMQRVCHENASCIARMVWINTRSQTDAAPHTPCALCCCRCCCSMEQARIKMYLCFQSYAHATRATYVLRYKHIRFVYLSISISLSYSLSLNMCMLAWISPGLIWFGFFSVAAAVVFVVVTVVFAHSSGPLRF